MATSEGSPKRPGRKSRMRGCRLTAPNSYLLFVPLIALFCWQLTSSYVGPVRDDTLAAVPEPSFPQARTAGTSRTAYRAEFLKPVPNPRFGESDAMLSEGYREVPGTLTPEMIAAQGDPFMLAYLSGAREGVLVMRARAGTVPTQPSGIALPRQ